MEAEEHELWLLRIREAVRAGMDDHVKDCHEKYKLEHSEAHTQLEKKITETERFMYVLTGIGVAVGAAFQWVTGIGQNAGK